MNKNKRIRIKIRIDRIKKRNKKAIKNKTTKKWKSNKKDKSMKMTGKMRSKQVKFNDNQVKINIYQFDNNMVNTQ